MKKSIICMMILVITLCSFSVPGTAGGIFPVEVSAKVSSASKKKAAREYRYYMDATGYPWFCMMDIDRDGSKELVVSHEASPYRLIIYKYRNGVVQLIGEDTTTFGYRYNKKTKRIHGLWGGCGSIQDWYLTISKSGKLKKVYLSMIEERVVNGKPVYSYSYAGKKISKKAYWKKKKAWDRDYVDLKMYKTSRKNIKKYIK